MLPYARFLLPAACALLLASCGGAPKKAGRPRIQAKSSGNRSVNAAAGNDALIAAAESQSSGKARVVLEQARKMTLFERVIVKGGCWDYLDLVFTRAGVPRNSRQTVHKGSLKGGPYADSSQIRPGDWLYYVNHDYRGNEHSGLFVGWVDEARRQGLVLSYVGENRREPARYKVYDLRSVYTIIRAP